MSAGPLPTRLSLLRIVSQGLVGATGAPDPTSAVRSLLAIQGQQVSAVPHAIVVRTPGADASDVRRAFDEGGLVRSWPMRGTVHVTTREDHHWLRSALAHRYESALRSTYEGGLDGATIDRAGALALELIASEGPVTRARLIGVWGEAGFFDSFETSPSGSAMSDAFNASWPRRRLLFALHSLGVLAQGPVGVNEHLIVDASSLPSCDEGPVGAGVERGGPRHREALAEIARRYAFGHGPVSAQDLARWASLPTGEAHRALEDALEQGSAGACVDGTTRPGLVRIRTDRGPRAGYRAEEGTPRRADADLLYMRADLEDLLADSEEEARATRFLAAFDELHVGYKDRTCLTDEAGEALICPSKNGMFRPILVERGRLVAVRPVKEGLIYAGSGAPSAALSRRAARSVEAVLARLA